VNGPTRNPNQPLHLIAHRSFFLTSNLINKQITERLESEGIKVKLYGEKDREKKGQIRKDIVALVENMVKDELKRRGPPEFARRVEVMPFITLSPLEQRIIVISEQDRYTARYKKPKEGDRKFGDIEIKFREDFVDYALKQYDTMQGASSLKAPVQKAVDSIFLPLLKKTPQPTEVWIYLSKYGGVQLSFEKPPEKEIEVKEEKKDDNIDTNQNSSSRTAPVRTPRTFTGNVKPVDKSF